MTDRPKLKLEIVTLERQLFTGEVDAVLAPGSEGQLGILPHHAPLIARLGCGELIARQGDSEESFAITGGFVHVAADRVVVLADAAEAACDIDVRRAEEARARAAQFLRQRASRQELIQAEAALRRSLTRLRVARRAPRGGPRMGGAGTAAGS